MTIDTYQAIKTLTADDIFSHVQAERLLELLAESDAMLATRADIQTLDSKIEMLRKDMDMLRKDMKTEIAAVRSDFSAEIRTVQSDIQLLQRDLTIKMYGGFLALAGVVLAAIKYL